MQIAKEEKKIGRPPAKWLLKLKPGVYSTEDLVMISKRDRNTVRQTLIRHGAKVHHKKQGTVVIALFTWKGFKN